MSLKQVRWNQTGTMQPARTTFFGFVPRLAAFYAALFILPGIQMPFFPVWLKAKGLDPKMIGLVLAVADGRRSLAIPLVTRAADRRVRADRPSFGRVIGSIAGYILVGFRPARCDPGRLHAHVAVFRRRLMPLCETYALKGLAARGRTYGPVRLWGSFAYIVRNFAAGFAADAIPAHDLIWLMVAASSLIAVAAWALEPLAVNRAGQTVQDVSGRTSLRHPVFIMVLAASGLIQASHAVFYGFSAVQWRAAGLDGTVIAALWALGVAAEIVLFAVQARLPIFFSPTVLLMTGAAAGTLRWFGMALDPPALVLPWLQVLHALSFGATHLGALMFLAHHAPAGKARQAQGHLAIATGLAMAAATGISGVLYADFGSRAYAAITSWPSPEALANS